MNNRKSISIDEFELIIQSLHREWRQDPKCISTQGDSTYYKGVGCVGLFMTSFDSVWVTIGKIDFECTYPSGWFSGKEKNRYKEVVRLITEMRQGKQPDSFEQLICEFVPSAKDVIAEKALVDDHE